MRRPPEISGLPPMPNDECGHDGSRRHAGEVDQHVAGAAGAPGHEELDRLVEDGDGGAEHHGDGPKARGEKPLENEGLREVRCHGTGHGVL